MSDTAQPIDTIYKTGKVKKTIRSAEEALLFKKITEDDIDAFGELYICLNQKVYFLCIKMTRNEQTARDLTQDAFLKLWEQRDKLKAADNAAAYFFHMVTNTILLHFKKEKNRENAAGTFSSADAAAVNPYTAMLGHEMKTRLQQCISQLSPQQKIIIFLQRYEEMSYKDIATLLRISPETVKQHIKNAHGHLRRQL